MKIFEAEEDIKGYLRAGTSLAIVGIAGCGKSTCIAYLKDLGFASVQLLTPTQQLRKHHEERFKNIVENLTVSTYASVVERANFLSVDYEAQEKPIDINADIVILDEVFATDYPLIKRVRKYLDTKRMTYIMLGDDRQSSRHDPMPVDIVCHGLPVIHIDESLRGTEENRMCIKALYDAVPQVEHIQSKVLGEYVRAYGGKVVRGFPTDSNMQYGFYENITGRFLVDNLDFKEKLFTGKVTYKGDSDDLQLSKKFESAPIISQDRKEMIQKIVGTKIPFATPYSTWSAITCIGCEVTDKDYGIVLTYETPVDLKSAYTLLSRQVDIARVTIFLVSKKSLGKKFFKRCPTLEVATEDGNLVELETRAPKRSITLANADILDIPKDSPKEAKLFLSAPTFRAVLDKTGIEYSGATQAIYTDRGEIRIGGDCKNFSDALTKWRVKDFSDKFKLDIYPELSTERPTNNMPQLLGEILQQAPGLACDPTELQDQQIFVSFAGLAESIPFNESKDAVFAYDEKDDAGLLSNELDLSDANKIMLEVDKLTLIDYQIDLVSAYYQCLTEYPEYIGYGDLVPFNAQLPISYYLCEINSQTLLLNSKIIEAYERLGIKLENKVGLASRTGVLGNHMTADLKAHINYSRQARFSKESLNFWGMYARPRFIEETYTKDGEKKPCITDFSRESCLYCFVKDIISIQFMLITAMKTTVGQDCIIQKDALKSNKPFALDKKLTPDWLKTPDIHYTASRNHAGNVDVLIDCYKAPHIIASLNDWISRKRENKRPSYTTNELTKVEERIKELNKSL